MTLPVIPRVWGLYRREDPTGVSGTGLVATGVVFPSGRAVMEWSGTTTGVRQVSVYDSLDDVLSIHGHQGRTETVWLEQHHGLVLLRPVRPVPVHLLVPEQRRSPET